MAASATHKTRALLRAHLAAASSYRHLTHQCPICHHLLRLATDSTPSGGPGGVPCSNPSSIPWTAPDTPKDVLEAVDALQAPLETLRDEHPSETSSA
jgi:hypothetical protein